MRDLRELCDENASVKDTATFGEAARALLESGCSALAVLRDDGSVRGLFTLDDLFRGAFPGYLGELRHTRFLSEHEPVRGQSDELPVTRFLSAPVTIEADAGPAHVVERFLHSPSGALAVCDGSRFVGMLEQQKAAKELLGKGERR